MNESIKKHFNIYRYLLFPYGIFPSSIAWYGAVRALEWIVEGVYSPWPSWTRVVVFCVGELIIISSLIVYSRRIPRGHYDNHNIFVLIYPECLDDDKYIAVDFVNNFKDHAAVIEHLNIITPSVVKRIQFNNKIDRSNKKGANYWESKAWHKLHGKLRGSLYISGSLSRRQYGQKEHFVFTLTGILGYNDFNKNITPIMIQELNASFPRRVLLKKEYEFEEFAFFSRDFAAAAQYLIGFAHLVSGNIPMAYKLHKDMLENNRQVFAKQNLSENLRKAIRVEIIAILKDCKTFPLSFINECSDTILKLFPQDSDVLLYVSRCKVMMSSESDFFENTKIALAMSQKARINKETRAVIHANRAYLNLLLGRNGAAEKEYDSFFKNFRTNVAREIIDYCEEQLKTGTCIEKPTAYYVRALMHQRLNLNTFEKVCDEAINAMPAKDEYYRRKLIEIRTAHSKGRKHNT